MGRGLRRAFILLLVQFIFALAGCSEGVSTTQNLNLIPIQKPPRISAGNFHTCAVASDGTLGDIKNITTFISYILPNADGEFANILKNVALILPKFEGKSRKELLDYVFKAFVAGTAP